MCGVYLDKRAAVASWEGPPQRARCKLVSYHHLEEGRVLKAPSSRAGTVLESKAYVQVPINAR